MRPSGKVPTASCKGYEDEFMQQWKVHKDNPFLLNCYLQDSKRGTVKQASRYPKWQPVDHLDAICFAAGKRVGGSTWSRKCWFQLQMHLFWEAALFRASILKVHVHWVSCMNKLPLFQVMVHLPRAHLENMTRTNNSQSASAIPDANGAAQSLPVLLLALLAFAIWKVPQPNISPQMCFNFLPPSA